MEHACFDFEKSVVVRLSVCLVCHVREGQVHTVGGLNRMSSVIQKFIHSKFHVVQ
uniref:Uncharacterized protein n=1 Tax=Arundo donax TaxID=35708 RepID=A0A0A9BXU2_ARUDO